MNIRKNLARICFAAASFFWVGCNDTTGPSDGVDTSSSVETSSSAESSSSAKSSSSKEQSSSSVGSSSSVRSSSSSSEWIPLMSATVYGIEPVFRSSSSAESSSSTESSSSSDVSSSSSELTSKIVATDSVSAAAAAVEACEGHGGVSELRAYYKPWTSPATSGARDAENIVKEQVETTLASGEAASFSEPKKSCLESVKADLGCVATMYGVPSPAEYDKWSAVCKDETIVKSDALKTLDEENEIIRKQAEEETLKKLNEQVQKCDSATEEEFPSNIRRFGC